MIAKIFFTLSVSWGALSDPSDIVSPEQENTNVSVAGVESTQDTCVRHDSFAALNKDTTINGKKFKAGTEFYFDDEGNAYDMSSNDETPVDIGESNDVFDCKNMTQMPFDETTGEFGEYSLPVDFQLAGPGKKPRKRKGKVTYCYRAVKAVVRRKITLTGGSAYMAYGQLRAKGWKKTSYSAAPSGAICVFGRGGRKTATGGHKHGHIGIKGRGGVINPQSGFRLGRPFLGCFHS